MIFLGNYLSLNSGPVIKKWAMSSARWSFYLKKNRKEREIQIFTA